MQHDRGSDGLSRAEDAAGDSANGAAPATRPRLTIGDYGVIGDCRSSALVGRNGSIDWLCWPRPDSPSLLAELVGPGAGCFRICPVGGFRATRHYLPGTNVLQTRFETPDGACTLTDLMTLTADEDRFVTLQPEHEILRRVRGERGSVLLEIEFRPRPDYARTRARLEHHGHLGWRLESHGSLYALRGEVGLRNEAASDDVLTGTWIVHAGETRDFSLVYAREGPAILRPFGDATTAAIERTASWWRTWSTRARYEGPYRAEVVRSALTLKLLTYAPSGAVTAASTTSLPERLGGSLNWDYRFCWLRDASLTTRALFGLGYHEEAESFLAWLVYTTRLTRPRLEVLYDVFGRRPPRETELGHLPGYRGSRPVRVGNGARDQLQLDVYGEVIDASLHFLRKGGVLDRDSRDAFVSFGNFVCRNWRCPDEGIWETRRGRFHHTFSRVMCWTALDRLLDLDTKGYLRLPDRARFEESRAQIRHEVETRGWNAHIGSYTRHLGGEELDASTLLLPWFGFERADTPRMRFTFRRIRERLGAGVQHENLLRRYTSDESEGEGAFGACSFWIAEFLALGGGTLDEARHAFAALLPYANDLGLYAEEIDPATGDALGNFPQAFTHVGLINAALSIEERHEGREQRPHALRHRHERTHRKAPL